MDYAPLMPAFLRHPKEAAIIGRMLAGYGELEFLLCMCLRAPLGDLRKAARLLFRNRGEEQRIAIADAILRPFYADCNLDQIWVTARREIGVCKDFRNQYSHCHWLDEDDLGLFFTNLEKGAKTLGGDISLEFFHVDVPLLEEQEAHFRHAGNHLIYLEAEQRRLAGKLRGHAFVIPPAKRRPPRSNPPEQHPIRKITLAGS
ncbi:hypothetical protein [Tardiphaga sp. 813_E8_N1_3]|uniref:hypothetical protein n=1 Tax=Tardiphaga sp. 813_E8_N1_3 TaxID=3240760 RepID=UPI003F291751